MCVGLVVDLYDSLAVLGDSLQILDSFCKNLEYICAVPASGGGGFNRSRAFRRAKVFRKWSVVLCVVSGVSCVVGFVSCSRCVKMRSNIQQNPTKIRQNSVQNL